MSGGAPVTLGDAGNPFGVSWGANDVILYGQPDGIWQVLGTGGTPVLLIPVGEGERFFGPQMLPGGEWVLLTVLAGTGTWDEAQIVVQSLVTDERVVLIEGGRDARYLPTGHLVYAINSVLLAVPFDLGGRRVIGGPAPLIEDVDFAPNQTGAAHFSVADNGSLVYIPGSTGAGAQRQLVWVDRQGREEPLAAPPRAYTHPRLSPDGRQVALSVNDQENDIWIWDLAREILRRLTFDPGIDRYPVWTPDGQRVAFGSNRSTPSDTMNLFWKAADGTGEVERLTESPNGQLPYWFSPEGTRLVYLTEGDLRVLSLEGDRPTEPLLATEFLEVNADFSPDGRWVAYQSNASGQHDIYVRPFPDVNQGLEQISTDGGIQPLWGHDGRELFYRTEAGLVVVPIETEPNFAAGTPEVVVEDQYPGRYNPGPGRTYDVALDGQRFLFIKDDTGQATYPSQINVVLNWHQELLERVPVP